MGDAVAPDLDDAGAVALGSNDVFNLSLDLLCIATVDGYCKRLNPAFERTLGYSAGELLSRPLFDFVHPEDLERTREAMAVLGGGRELHQFENRFICRDGSTRWLQWNIGPGPGEGLVAAAARDVTDSRARLEQAALRHVATLVAHGASPTDVFNAVAAEVASQLEADVALVGRYEADATLSHVAANPVTLLAVLGPRTALDGHDLASIVRRTGQPACIIYDDAPGPLAALARRLGVRRAVGAPILVEDRIWGVMTAGWTHAPERCPGGEPRLVPSDAAGRIAEFTELVAIAIANAETRSELVASRARVVLASDDTRRRIERDLHDGAQQRLVTLALKLRWLTSTVPAGSDDLRAALGELASGLEVVLDELREQSRGIHPAVLSKGGLGPAVKALARRAPIPVEVDVQPAGRLPERMEVAAYYVIAEALTNAAKHGRASEVVVRVEEHEDGLRVSICDDGVGGADPSAGSGLLGLRDRVDVLGGTMSLSSPPGDGTAVVVHLPWSADSHGISDRPAAR